MLLVCSLQPLILHVFLPTERIVAQKGMAIANQQRTGHELTWMACGIVAKELTPNGLRAYEGITAKCQHLLTEPQLGRSGQNVEVAQVNVVAAGVAHDA